MGTRCPLTCPRCDRVRWERVFGVRGVRGERDGNAPACRSSSASSNSHVSSAFAASTLGGRGVEMAKVRTSDTLVGTDDGAKRKHV